jgi:Ca-activated chloride channel family protein
MRPARVISTLLLVAGLMVGPSPAVEPSSDGMPGTIETSPPKPPAGGAPSPSGKKLDDATIERILKIQDEEQVAVHVVLVPASVEDKKGRIVTGLTAKDFTLRDESVLQQIKYFSVESNEPVSIAFLLDVSGSMRQSGKLDAAKEAVRHFVDELRPQDRFALICFADEQVAWVTPFTSDRQRFLERLMVQEGYGQTALNDAVAATPKLVDEATSGRKAIVLITDGVDNASRLTVHEAIQTARKVEVPIFTIGFTTIPWDSEKKLKDLGFNMGVLRMFADETGGDVFVVRGPDEMKESVVRISTQLRHQYLIGYSPGLERWDGRFRNIQLLARNGRYVVRTRKGYYANP